MAGGAGVGWSCWRMAMVKWCEVKSTSEWRLEVRNIWLSSELGPSMFTEDRQVSSISYSSDKYFFLFSTEHPNTSFAEFDRHESSKALTKKEKNIYLQVDLVKWGFQ